MKKKTLLINILISILFVLSYNHYFFEDYSFGNGSIFNLLLLSLAIMLLNKSKYNKDKKSAYLFSLILSLSIVIGKVMYNYDTLIMFFKKSFVINIISIVSFTKIFGELFYLISNMINNYNYKGDMPSIFLKKYSFFLIWGFIFVLWIPAFLAYYPGILSYDSPSQTWQAFMGISNFNNLNPATHTFIWYLCINISKLFHIEPLAFYSITQMIFFSFVTTKVVKLMIDKKSDKWIIITAILFFALNPAIAIFSMSMTKDIYFTAFFILFVLEMYKIEDNEKDYLANIKNWIVLLLVTVFMCLFRNNGIIVVFLVLIIYLIKHKYLLLPLVAPIIVYFMITFVMFPIFGISGGAASEGLSISMQQISFATHENYESIDDATLHKINDFIPYEKIMSQYNPRFADPIKSNFNNDYFNNHKGEYLGLYLKLFFKYPMEYISAFLTTNLSYWYIDGDGGAGESTRVYIETANYKNGFYDPIRNSKLPILLNIYEKVASYQAFENIPLLNYLFSITTPFWITLFTLFLLINKKSDKKIVVITILSLWLNYMLGPVSNFRYIFPLMVLYPLLLFLIFNANSKIQI